MVPGDRLVCVLLQPLEPGTAFHRWPLHITIVPWFRSTADTKALTESLRDALQSRAAFTIAANGAARFGRGGAKHVRLVKLPSPLMDIERVVRDLLHNRQAWLVDETTRVRREYKPHVTD